MSKGLFLTWIYNEFRDDLGVTPDLPCEIEFYFYPGSPGRISGPPEQCYPPEEEELEITGIKDPTTKRELVVTDDMLKTLYERTWAYCLHLKDEPF